MEVHPPHHPLNTWRDFFVHIATICVGLLIAIGLEQTVEALHHHHQREQLREALIDDVKQSIADCQAARDADIHVWLADDESALQDAIDHHHPFTEPPQPTTYGFNLPDDPAWKAARASGLLPLLDQDEVKTFNELDSATSDVHDSMQELAKSQAADYTLILKFNRPGKDPDYATATPDDLRARLNSIRQLHALVTIFMSKVRDLQAEDQAVLNGSRDLREVRRAGTSNPRPRTNAPLHSN